LILKEENMFDVLSLFDGISCGQPALERADIKVNKYYASEIEESAIKITQKNYPKTRQIGNILNVNGNDFKNIGILIGGSPCQGLSRAKTDRLNLKDDRSILFFEYVRILKESQPKYFLLENVKMDKESEMEFTRLLQVEPIEINSALVSAQNRKRLYWTNIPNVTQPKDKGILIKDILEETPYELFQDKRIEETKIKTKNYYKWDVSGKGYYSQQDRAYFKDGKMCCVPKSQVKSKVNVVESEGVYRRFSPVEVERLQTLPDNYTLCDGVSNTKRYESVGNGWTVDVIAHILSFIHK
jgi:site-specific DNA-cytosine methylase